MRTGSPYLLALASAASFGMSVPFAKMLTESVGPVALAGLLYLGAFLGLAAFHAVRAASGKTAAARPLGRSDLPCLAGAITVGGIASPMLLMMGISMISGFSASLLTSLEGLATCIIAVLLFHEHAGGRLWGALLLMTAAGALLTWDPAQGEWSWTGVGLIGLAMAGWGLDNNLTQRISDADPVRVVMLKGLVAGCTSLAVALLLGQQVAMGAVPLALLLGAASYGLSLVLFIGALRGLGSARTSAVFSTAPFVGALLSIVLLAEVPALASLAAFSLMALGAYLVVTERHGHRHRHPRTVHEHPHRPDSHHTHVHQEGGGVHSHEHEHQDLEHSHVHWPDAHHRHEH